MKKNKPFSIPARARSFKYAFEGIASFLKSEHNSILHLLATLAVIVLAFLFPVSRMEVIALVWSVGFVWVAELFNTAIEKIMDFITPEQLPAVKFIKDVSAAAVLIAAIAAFITGCIVFIPKL
jgi:diacylglycerol kinase (ATP)